jgi:imidazolonepropionase-like amidohydrolase
MGFDPKRKMIRTCGIIFFLSQFALQMNAQPFNANVSQFIYVNVDTLALIHAKIVDGTGGASKSDQTIIIIKGRIAQLGNSNTITVGKTIRTLDCSGKTIIPGMIMMHEHLFYGESVPPTYLGLEMPVSFPKLYLAGGVTTMRTTGSTEPQTDLNIKNWIDQGKMAGPDIDVTGPYIERAFLPIPEVQFIKSPEEAGRTVSYWMDRGCTSFKVYMDITKEDLQEVVRLAHERKLSNWPFMFFNLP